MFLKNKNIISKIRRSKVTDCAALRVLLIDKLNSSLELHVYDQTPNLVNFVLMSLTANHASFMLKANHVMESFYEK